MGFGRTQYPAKKFGDLAVHNTVAFRNPLSSPPYEGLATDFSGIFHIA